MTDTVTVDVRELPGRLAELADLAAAGTVVLVRDGDATTRLGAVGNDDLPPPRVLGLHPGAITILPGFWEPEEGDEP